MVEKPPKRPIRPPREELFEEPAWLRDAPPPVDAPPSPHAGAPVVPMVVPAPKRPLRSRSYLSILTILSDPALRKRVLGDQTIEFDELHGVVTIGRRPIGDHDASVIRAQVEQNFQGDKDGNGMRFSVDDIERALQHVASKHRYHPVQEYLRSLEWDGTDRFPWLASVVLGLGTAATKLDITLLRKWAISAVARAMEPGCKCDTVMVLVGPQGARKSTFFKTLAGADWFCDSSFDPSTKDGADSMTGAWIYEWPELEAMQRARTQNSVKAFITTQVDVFRPPYARHKVRKPRTCVIVGTTNDDDFLTDSTGHRRYWPIRISERIATDQLAAARDQLWAQAFDRYSAGELWHLEHDDEVLLKQAQAEFEVTTAWDDIVRAWLGSRLEDTLTIAQVMEGALRLNPGSWSKSDEQKAAGAMRRAGWVDFRARLSDGSRPRVWRRADAAGSP